MLAVTHVITGLERGGAEMMLYKLAKLHVQRSIETTVISLTDEGNLGAWIRACGVAVHALGMKRGIADPRAIVRLSKYWRTRRPDVIQTWMYHADLIGGLAAKLDRSPPVVWGVRQSNLDPAQNKKLTLITAQVCARLSRWLPSRIVCCSEAAAEAHAAIGYDRPKITVIPNGFDVERYRAEPAARLSVRASLGIGAEQLVVGMVARFDAQKDHKTFVEAARILRNHRPEVRFVLIGDGITSQNTELRRHLEEANVAECFHLLGRRDDIVPLINAFDIASLSSVGEGFPNAIGEAMACEVPCVVTNAGDSPLLVGDTGRVVPVGNPAALAEAWQQLLELPVERRRAMGSAARARIMRYFDIEAVADRYASLYADVASATASN